MGIAEERAQQAGWQAPLWADLYSTRPDPVAPGWASYGGELIGTPVAESLRRVAGARAGAAGLAGAEVITVDAPAAQAAATLFQLGQAAGA